MARQSPAVAAASTVAPSSEVFIVHGHDHGTKETVARFLEKLGLAATILHEQPDGGRALIQKRGLPARGVPWYLFSGTPMAPPFRLTFPRSSSSAYREAVRLATQSPTYAETQDGRPLVHTATFGTSPDELATLAELWGLVRGWKGVRLEVDGAGVLPRERARIGEVLECAARAATFPEPAAYCTSAPPASWSPWPGRPPFPCRLLATTQRGAIEAGVEWDQPARRMIQVRALLVERGIRHCPFLALGPFEAALATWTPQRAAAAAPGLAGIRIEIGVTDQEEPTDQATPAIPDTVDELLREWSPEERGR